MSFYSMWLTLSIRQRSANRMLLRAGIVATVALAISVACPEQLLSQATAQNPNYQPTNLQGGFPRPYNNAYQPPQNYQANYPLQPQAGNSNQQPGANGVMQAPTLPMTGSIAGPDARLAATTNNTATTAPNQENDTSDSEANSSSVRSLLQLFRDGGFMMYPIALCSFAMMVFSFERFISLRSGRVIPRPFVKRLIEQLQQQQIDRDEALELCERNPSPIANVLTAGVKRYGRPAVEVEQAILDAGEREANTLRRHMRLLNGISQVAPLLGLLGTVFGMIQSFNSIAVSQAMGRPELLAGGIGEALVTTAAGLLVAIPAYVLYMYFLGHTDKLVMEIDSHSQRLVEVISAEGLQENDTSRSRTRTRKAA